MLIVVLNIFFVYKRIFVSNCFFYIFIKSFLDSFIKMYGNDMLCIILIKCIFFFSWNVLKRLYV